MIGAHAEVGWRRGGRQLSCLGCIVALGCGGRGHADIKAPVVAGNHRGEAAEDDGSRCEFRGRADREVTESVGTGAIQPSIRRVYRVLGEGEQRRRVLICREVDTNLDGVKDLVRRYNEQGEALEEQADSDYDGKLDTWVRFAKGRMSQVSVDLDRDGTPDETRYYVAGKLSRVQRDTNHDGKPDIWEIYAAGHLERMGIDVDFDGRVDRWNRDGANARSRARRTEEAQAGAVAAPTGSAATTAP
jgi:hypothetical protein